MREIFVKFYLFFVIVVLFFSCSTSVCLESRQYNLAITYYNTLESTYKGKGALVGQNLLANLILANITGIESKASYGDITVYSKRIDFNDDMRNWKNWILDISCKIDLELMKEKEREILLKSNWIEK